MSEEKPTGEGVRFRKFNITKMDLPYPFWSDERAAGYCEQYGGEDSVGWQTNVLGKWGSPTYSVFPMPILKPNLRYIPAYRIVVASVDRQEGRVNLRAARLSPDLETVEGSRREELLTREQRPMLNGKDLGAAIAAFFPDLTDWTDPLLYCGGDLGSATDPSEFLFIRRAGLTWTDIFRLHLANADWPVQAEVVAYLDHASGHRVRYGFDNGSAGAALVQVLTQMEAFRVCPVCKVGVYFAERLRAFGFGEYTEEIDVETGEVLPNPDKKDAEGNEVPHRLSNKEFSTRVLERKAQAAQLAIAHDEGAGDQKLGAAQLLVNHTSSGITAKGERRFRGEDDHHVDARRQAVLIIASEKRGDPWYPADPALIVRSNPRGGGFGPSGSVGSGFGVLRGGSGRIFSGEPW